MYNRYIPQPDGSYRRTYVEEEKKKAEIQATDPIPCPTPQPIPIAQTPKQKSAPCPRSRPVRPTHRERTTEHKESPGDFLRKLLPKDFDTSDLFVVLLLLLMAGDNSEDKGTALLTLALYFIM